MLRAAVEANGGAAKVTTPHRFAFRCGTFGRVLWLRFAKYALRLAMHQSQSTSALASRALSFATFDNRLFADALALASGV